MKLLSEGKIYKIYLKVNKHRNQLKTKTQEQDKIMKRLVIHQNDYTWIFIYMYTNQCSKVVVGE